MRWFSQLSVISLAFLTLASRSTANESLRHVEDSTLRSVHFIDQKEGWVVGDEGVILHTLNGGKTWHRQPTGLHGHRLVIPMVANGAIGSKLEPAQVVLEHRNRLG